jgi:hypothetical protein
MRTENEIFPKKVTAARKTRSIREKLFQLAMNSVS